MSSASIPPPRTSTTTRRSSGSARHTLFLPIFIFLIGATSLACYQTMTVADQLQQLTQTGEQMDGKVKHAQYEKTKFYRIARDILQIADKNSNADAIATRFKLRKLASAKPELFSGGASDDDLSALNASTPAASTNAAPSAAPATNAAPNPPPAPAK